MQDSAAPFHDWNKRVSAECYEPNAGARLLDEDGRIRRIVNNYEQISFNFGPTLLAWLETEAPCAYEKVLEGDRLSRERRDGHGNALAQAYNHVIMPLASDRDRRTQIVWGMEDFRHRYGRDPEGMWLPEAAVDTETLTMMAKMGIAFTVLAPSQALRWRLSDGEWNECAKDPIDPSRAYHVSLPGGRAMALFFYDGAISQAVAFEGLLGNGEFFLGRFEKTLRSKRDWAPLAHIATDGESYGHHHRFGEMALAYAVEKIEERGLATLTNYGQYLALHPPMAEAEIVERSSWSCAHGVERWRADCGCSTGRMPGWRQTWRKPLRDALDALKVRVDTLYESQARKLFEDPWATRDRYVEVVLARDQHKAAEFVKREATGGLANGDQSRALSLLEAQRHAMLMYTSCGWFFDEISGIEPTQNLLYASRVIQLASEFGHDWEPDFLERLSLAPSNDPRIGSGRAVYERSVRPQVVDDSRVIAHYAISRALETNGDAPELHGYDVEVGEFERHDDGSNSLTVGRARALSHRTLADTWGSFAVLCFGGRDIHCGVSVGDSPQAFTETRAALEGDFHTGSLTSVVRGIDQRFVHSDYGFRDLFVEARRRALASITADTIEEMEASLSSMYDRRRPMISLMRQSGAPLPAAFQALCALMCDRSIRSGAQAFIEDGDDGLLCDAIEECRRSDIEPDLSQVNAALRDQLLAELRAIAAGDGDDARVDAFNEKLRQARSIGLTVPLRELQNMFFDCRMAVSDQDDDAGFASDAWRALARWLEFDATMLDQSRP